MSGTPFDELELNDYEQRPGAAKVTLASRINDVDQQRDQLAAVIGINDKHALISEQGRVVIVTERYDRVLQRNALDRSNAADFKLFYRNRSVRDGKRNVPLGDFWLDHPQRRQYNELVFDPSPTRKDDPSVYNLWHGWSVAPAAADVTRGTSCSLFKAHLLEIGCGGDSDVYEYMLDWFAWMFQRPDLPGGTCIVLRGPEGAGKGVIMRAIGKICGQHFIHVSQLKQRLGHSNGHLHDAIFVFSDEAFWAGDVANTGALKTLITEPTLMVERKHRDVFSVPNRVHLMMATNNDWAAPVSVDDRRFCIVDVPDKRVGQKQYFDFLNHELDNGGLEAFLFEMMVRNVRSSPLPPLSSKHSAATLTQKMMTLGPIPKWWYERLESGTITRKHDGWPSEVLKQELHEDYLSQMDRLNISRRASETDLAIHLKQFARVFTRRRTDFNGKRPYIWELPTLAECRESFAKMMHMPYLFPVEPDDI